MDVLFVCSVGMLRSATAARHFNQTLGWNTRCAGSKDYAIQPVHENTLNWADRIYFMKQENLDDCRRFDFDRDKAIVLDIEDHYTYMQPALIDLLESKIDHQD